MFVLKNFHSRARQHFFLHSGEVLTCEREPDNDLDRYAIAVKKEGTIVGHFPVVFSLLGFNTVARLL